MVLKKIYEHYLKWQVVYGAAAFIVELIITVPLNEPIRHLVLLVWKVSHILGGVTAFIFGLIIAALLGMAVNGIYTLAYGRIKKEVGYADEDEADE